MFSLVHKRLCLRCLQAKEVEREIPWLLSRCCCSCSRWSCLSWPQLRVLKMVRQGTRDCIKEDGNKIQGKDLKLLWNEILFSKSRSILFPHWFQIFLWKSETKFQSQNPHDCKLSVLLDIWPFHNSPRFKIGTLEWLKIL